LHGQQNIKKKKAIRISIKFKTNKYTLYWTWQSFKIYIKNHFDLLLHVSVYDHHQAAFNTAQLK